ncbi:MAG: AAA family ATPase [Verrucomicrobiota bacterium]
MPQNLASLPAFLAERIIGQPQAMEQIAQAVQRAELGLTKPNRPKGVFLLLGPTGVGKTETVLNLSRFLHGEDAAPARFDMGEYGHEDSLMRLLGADRNDPGLLGREIDARPQGGILLLDEIEKAHVKISKVFLAAADAARLTPADGRTRDLSRWYIVFTSNLGSGDAVKMSGVPYTMLARTVMQSATAFFAPETIARFQHKIVFNSLIYEVQRRIAESLIGKEARHLSEVLSQHYNQPCTVTCGPGVITFIVRKGHTREMGARNMRDTVESEMGNPVADWMLRTQKLDHSVSIILEAGSSATSLSVQAPESQPGGVIIGGMPQLPGIVFHGP